MRDVASQWGFLRALTWDHALLIGAIVVGCVALTALVRGLVRRVAEEAPSQHRLLILRAAPFARLAITIAGVVIVTPLLVEPTFDDVVALVATVGLALAFALRDFISCLVAGIVTIVENTYQPGDWIEFDGAYGEVKTIGMRAVHIVTGDDVEVAIPHSMLWTSSVHNHSGGLPTLLTVTHFYLDPDHDGAAVSQALTEVAVASPHLKPGAPVKIATVETPFAARYSIRAYVGESREQFAMITDLTLRGRQRLREIGARFAKAPYSPPV